MPLGGDRGLSCLAALRTIAPESFELTGLTAHSLSGLEVFSMSDFLVRALHPAPVLSDQDFSIWS